ncbi:MAG: hypothetical protein KDE59_01895 [Anaerolineales bacterium]|nr:hypothetical protein [Anaerolineales bacterium]MCB0015414.1 hypothetical protein [Anaerolineales bacterium]
MRRPGGDKFLKKINKKARRGYRGEPIATISYYGPDDKTATKAAVGIVYSDKKEVQMHRWFNEDLDVRRDPVINEAIFHLIEEKAAASVVRLTEINGCPHEEGVDYPAGEDCPHCPFWAGRERLTDRIQKMVAEHEANEGDTST